jgi:hypothetical protein
VISTDEDVGKIKAAVDARRDPDLLIMARTDACATHGFEAAIERAQKFSEAGADILFVEAVTAADEVRACRSAWSKPQLMNMVIGGKTPIFGAEELGGLGFGFVLYANAALQGAVAGMQKVLDGAARHRRVDEDPALVVPLRRAPAAGGQARVGRAGEPRNTPSTIDVAAPALPTSPACPVATVANTAMKDRIVIGLASVSTNTDSIAFSGVVASCAERACVATGARRSCTPIHARKAAPPSASGTRAATIDAMTADTPSAPMAP